MTFDIKLLNSMELPTHLEKIIKLDKKQFPYPWSESNWRDFSINSGNYDLFIITKDSQFLGFSLLVQNKYSLQVHLLKIVIDFDRRGESLGCALLEKIISHYAQGSFESIYLEVCSLNVPAMGLYEKLGFEKMHLKKRYYSDGADAYAMQLALNKTCQNT